MESLAPPGLPPAGFLLSLLTESFAVRALLGSLIAVVFAAVALRSSRVRSPRARRLLVLAPVVAAAAAAGASLVEAESYLPQLWIAAPGGTPGRALELLGEFRVISNARSVDLLFLGWALAAAVLLLRRMWGGVATRRLLRRATPAHAESSLRLQINQLCRDMGLRRVDVRLLDGCPGGALAAGIRSPIVVIDSLLPAALDERELEGLLAHELAHIARRDTLLCLIVGIVGDLAFFLPPVRVGIRWLHREREESADDWASGHTHRPAALASGILKVFSDATPGAASLRACAAVPGAVAVAGGRSQLSEGARVVAARVERLVAPPRGRTAAQQVAEVCVAALLVVTASATAIVVPQWIATELDAYSLAIGYVPPPVTAVESPAFATFRALAPFAAGDALRGYERTLAPASAVRGERLSTCPCVESQAQWLAGVPATGPQTSTTMTWRRTAGHSWDVTPGPGSVRARPLLTLREAGPQVGFFVVAESGS